MTNFTISALVDSVASLPAVLPVTPLTTFVDSYASGQAQAGQPLLTAHQYSNKVLTGAYGFSVGTQAEQLIPSFASTASANATQALAVLGGLESEATSLGAPDRGSLVTALSQDISDGVFDGSITGQSVMLGTNALPATAGPRNFCPESRRSESNVAAIEHAVQTVNQTLPVSPVTTGGTVTELKTGITFGSDPDGIAAGW